jgi:predicted hydrocarbon binding protein
MDLAASWPFPSQALPEIYPAQIGQLLISSYEEVLGRPGLQTALKKARLKIPEIGATISKWDLPFEAPALLAQAVVDLHSEQAGGGLCLRAGRVMFRRGVREFSNTLGLTDRGFRLLSPAQKILRGMDLLAWLLNHFSDQRVHVETTPHFLLLVNERCPHCWGIQRAAPACALPVGALQEGLAWASGGKRFAVEETTCRAKGDPTCTFQINRKPL